MSVNSSEKHSLPLANTNVAPAVSTKKSAPTDIDLPHFLHAAFTMIPENMPSQEKKIVVISFNRVFQALDEAVVFWRCRFCAPLAPNRRARHSARVRRAALNQKHNRSIGTPVALTEGALAPLVSLRPIT